jgi:hypothetical protein
MEVPPIACSVADADGDIGPEDFEPDCLGFLDAITDAITRAGAIGFRSCGACGIAARIGQA